MRCDGSAVRLQCASVCCDRRLAVVYYVEAAMCGDEAVMRFGEAAVCIHVASVSCDEAAMCGDEAVMRFGEAAVCIDGASVSCGEAAMCGDEAAMRCRDAALYGDESRQAVMRVMCCNAL